jgi:Domain of unknown function (DUF1877)
MSVNLEIRTIADADIAAILEQPLLLQMLQYGEVVEIGQFDEMEPDEKVAILSWKPKTVSETFYVEGRFQSFNYLLSGYKEHREGSFPLNFLMAQDLKIGEVGWGPAIAYYSHQVKLIADILVAIDKQQFLVRFDIKLFKELSISPRNYDWRIEDGEELFNEFVEMRYFLIDIERKQVGIYLVFV